AAAAGASGATPYRGRRRTIGERMHQSLGAMAQLTLSSETRVDEATAMIHGLNREWRADRVVVTLTALAVKACALALREHPALNARLEGDQIVSDPAVNVGFALDQDAGLLVPVVRGADALPLKEVARTIADLNERAKSGRLSPDDMTGGTFTVTSLEGTVVDAFTPVVNPPQAAILGLGRVREVAVVEGGAVTRAQTAVLSLTFDHRLLDGAPAARFLGRVAELLGRPYLLV
ncbi:MAG: 2-oxo acid dehydrogenase subunit E2, partial [Chloroflexi bacterium]|nr:2-oxo acid dehydrogenase subunit E2 [Chloroflexota bacterium]